MEDEVIEDDNNVVMEEDSSEGPTAIMGADDQLFYGDIDLTQANWQGETPQTVGDNLQRLVLRDVTISINFNKNVIDEITNTTYTLVPLNDASKTVNVSRKTVMGNMF